MTGVPRHIGEHRLNVREGCLPVRQKKRGQAPEINKAISEEVKKLVEADIMKEVHYHSWLSNPVMVKKHDDSWRMCVDFKDLNKACPKDGYPLPEIDWKRWSNLPAFSGKAFQKQIGRNLEVYVDDLVIKSRTKKEVIRDAEETFKRIRKINMKLNPKKCAFGMREGTFLGYKVDADGLRVSSDKVKAVLNLPSPKCLKDVQKLNEKLASLNRFLSKSAKKSLPFFKTLKKCTKKSDFQWTPKAEEAFKEMKQSIAKLPMLTAPKEKEELIVYLAAAKEAISAVLMTERDGKQARTIIVITDQPIKQLLPNPEVTGRLLKWRLELGEHDIQYRPRTSVKGQILADFIVERPEDGTPDTPMEDREELPDPWILFTDGSSCVDGFGAGLIIMNPEGMEFTYALRFRFNATNNEAEYEALTAGLRIASQMGKQNLQANVDSKLLANQKANTLSKIASTSFAHLSKQVLVEELREKEIDEKEILAVVEEEGHTWMTPVYEYLTEGVLPEEKKKARTVRRKAGRYVVINEVLYKNYFLGPWLRYVGPLQANYVLREIHEGSCSMHAGPRSVVAKVLGQEKLTPITSPWPFYKWGIDIAGPFPEGPGKVKFLIVSIDYFTKWIEAKRVATITVTQVKKFVWDNIVCRFSLPGEIISNNGKQFRDNPFKDWCEKLNIRQCFASIKHPQANGLVERENRSLGEGIKALIPAEIGMPTLRTAEVDMAKNNEALGINLDLLEEKREQAAIQEAKNKAKMKGYYNARVRSTNFRTGDFVYRNNEASHAEDGGKLGPKWEGPYEVTEALGKGAYKLKERNGHTFREHGTSATLKSVTYMKCKHPFARKAKRKKKTLGILFVCNIFKFFNE
nr:reverse transcriptase domain-containing protein [Tanacetum cinerariifolium]